MINFTDLIAVKYVSHIFKKMRLKHNGEGNRERERERKGEEHFKKCRKKEKRHESVDRKMKGEC